MSWNSRKKKEGIFCVANFVQRNFFIISVLPQCSALNTLSEYIYFYILKNITSYTFLHVFKIIESLHCILKQTFSKMEHFAKIVNGFQALKMQKYSS